eukprot:tig00020710_g13338.t1
MVRVGKGHRNACHARVRADETRKFISTMSHEMRTPLNGIIGMLQLAKDCELSEEAAEFVEAASVSGEHLLSIVNDSGSSPYPAKVLDLQKIEAGLIELQSAPTQISDLVEASVRIVQPRAGAKGLILTSSVDPRVPAVVMTDPDRTRQCLLNLVSNAVKYTLRGSVQVCVTVEKSECTGPCACDTAADTAALAEAGAGDGIEQVTAGDNSSGPLCIKFCVSDTGPGIDAESQRQLFTRFYRVRHDAKDGPDPGGTGLGLAISKEIISKMGGQIGCSSELGRGSVFWFCIPLLPVVTPGPPARPMSFSAWEEPPELQLPSGAGSRRPPVTRSVSMATRETDPESRGDFTGRPAVEAAPVSPLSPTYLSCKFSSGLDGPAPRPTSSAEEETSVDAASGSVTCTQLQPFDREPRSSSTDSPTGRAARRRPSACASTLSTTNAGSGSDYDTSSKGGPTATVTAVSSAPVLGRGSPQPLGILVVEDNEMNTRVLRAMLEREGHHIAEAHDGLEVLYLIWISNSNRNRKSITQEDTLDL